MKFQPLTLALALAALGSSATQAQSSVTVYGRVDLSVAQQADAVSNKEVRNGSGSRLGFRGTEDLGDGLKAVFQIEHRFDANTGATTKAERFWDGKAIVGIDSPWGRVVIGREENPAYTYSQGAADPWGTDTVATNGSLVNGRIGTARYSNSVNYRFQSGGLSFGAQVAEANGNTPATGTAQDRPYSLGAAWVQGPLTLGVGFENPADADDHWSTVNARYDFGLVKIGGLYGAGKNGRNEALHSWLVTAVAPIGAGDLRLSYGQLKNHDLASNGTLDKQLGLGYHYALSKRTTVYVDLVNEQRDGMAGNLVNTGYDLGIKHNF